jgi:hypothetical protein
MRYLLAIEFNLIMRINQNRKNQVKSIYSFVTAVVFLMSTNAFAQRTMFGSNNNYVAPVAPFQAPVMVTNGLKLYLDAANSSSYPGSGSVWTDLSGNNNHATLINNPTFNSGNGGSIYTNGNNQYAISSYAGSATDSYTYSVWFKNDNNSEAKYLLTRGRDGEGNGWSLQVQITTGGIATAAVVPTVPSTVGILVSGTSLLALNTWYNITAVWAAGQSIKIYVNGVLEGTTTTNYTSLRTSTSGWVIGSVSTSLFTSGNNAVAQVYNRALSDAEIMTNYNAVKSRFGY